MYTCTVQYKFSLMITIYRATQIEAAQKGMHIPFICPIFHGSLFSCFFPRFVKVDSLFKVEMGCSKYWQTNIMENISCE